MNELKHYLMIKTHKKTGLKYLCKKTTDDIKKCYRYKGSGSFWKRHLQKHGSCIDTKIIEICDNISDLHIKALYWSDYYNVVSSVEWANLVPENGSNINDRTYNQMVENRKNYHRKMKGNMEYHDMYINLGRLTSMRQLGVTMKERMGNEWQDPRKGKRMKDIYKPGHLHPQIKPFKITLNDGERVWIFKCESDVRNIGLYPYPTLGNLKKHGTIYIKQVSSKAKHEFEKGDKLSFEYIDKALFIDLAI